MEEILASIRRIISEDEAPAEAAPAAAAEPEPEPAAEPEPAMAQAPPPEPEPESPPAPAAMAAEEEDDDALELTQKVETLGDLDVLTPTGAPEPQPAAAPVAAATASLVSERAASAAASAFGQLSAVIAMPREGRTLEDVVRELLTPLLQQWLDDNLPRIVQETVEAEVARIARGRVA